MREPHIGAMCARPALVDRLTDVAETVAPGTHIVLTGAEVWELLGYIAALTETDADAQAAA